jgi:RimJ/RimL family protein N-acetyltransferase
MLKISPSQSGSNLFLGLSRDLNSPLYLFLKETEFSPRVSIRTRLLYNMIGDRLIFLAHDVDCNPKNTFVSAVNIYYFNDFDATHGLNTVHEAFIGVHRLKRGKGLATDIRETAYMHFKLSSLDGITTRIKKDNLASISSARKLGFSIPDQFKKYQFVDDELYMFRPL